MCRLSKDMVLLSRPKSLIRPGTMTDEPKQARDGCAKCGKDALRLVAGRVGNLTGAGYANLFQCSGCGHLDWRDIPHQPPGKRT